MINKKIKIIIKFWVKIVINEVRVIKFQKWCLLSKIIFLQRLRLWLCRGPCHQKSIRRLTEERPRHRLIGGWGEGHKREKEQRQEKDTLRSTTNFDAKTMTLLFDDTLHTQTKNQWLKTTFPKKNFKGT